MERDDLVRRGRARPVASEEGHGIVGEQQLATRVAVVGIGRQVGARCRRRWSPGARPMTLPADGRHRPGRGTRPGGSRRRRCCRPGGRSDRRRSRRTTRSIAPGGRSGSPSHRRARTAPRWPRPQRRRCATHRCRAFGAPSPRAARRRGRHLSTGSDRRTPRGCRPCEPSRWTWIPGTAPAVPGQPIDRASSDRRSFARPPSQRQAQLSGPSCPSARKALIARDS